MSSRELVGLLCMSLAMIALPAGDAIAKYLMDHAGHSPGFLAWVRFALGASLIVPFAWAARGSALLGGRFLAQQLLRAALISATIFMMITAVGQSPLPNVFGAFFVGPIVSLLLAVVWLRERATARDGWSVAIGFLGVLLVIQPGGTIDAGVWWGFGAGLCYGTFLAATRWSAGHGTPILQLAAQLVFGTVLLLPFALRAPGGINLMSAPIGLVLMCLCSVSANLLSLMAYARASAAWLAPVVYLQLIAATVIGIAFFGDDVDTVASIGLVLIVLTGLLRLPIRQR